MVMNEVGIYGDYRWLVKVIESCKNEWQLLSCCNLIELFYIKYTTHYSKESLTLILYKQIDKRKAAFMPVKEPT